MAWVDFAICFFFGFFGIHKFREKKVGMGILYLCTAGLFGIGWIYDSIKYFIAAIKNERLNDLPVSNTTELQLADDEPLPVVLSCNVVMTSGEICHYYAPAAFVTTKNVVVGYSGGNSGVSVRVMKGMSYHIGSSKAKPIRGNVQEKTLGNLAITNKRIVFSGNKGAFDKKITALSSITPYNDGVSLQFGEKQYPLLCDNPSYVCQIIARIINTSES